MAMTELSWPETYRSIRLSASVTIDLTIDIEYEVLTVGKVPFLFMALDAPRIDRETCSVTPGRRRKASVCRTVKHPWV